MSGDWTKKCIVYQALNIKNGKRYIGATIKGLHARKMRHFNCARLGHPGKFYTAIRSHGPDAFVFTEMMECRDFFHALEEEERLIAELKPEYNVTAGGGGVKGHSPSPEGDYPGLDFRGIGYSVRRDAQVIFRKYRQEPALFHFFGPINGGQVDPSLPHEALLLPRQREGEMHLPIAGKGIVSENITRLKKSPATARQTINWFKNGYRRRRRIGRHLDRTSIYPLVRAPVPLCHGRSEWPSKAKCIGATSNPYAYFQNGQRRPKWGWRGSHHKHFKSNGSHLFVIRDESRCIAAKGQRRLSCLDQISFVASECKIPEENLFPVRIFHVKQINTADQFGIFHIEKALIFDRKPCGEGQR